MTTKNIFPTLILASLALFACNSEPAEDAPQKVFVNQVETTKVKAIKFQETIFGSGKLSLKEEANLSFKTGGIIEKIYVSEGQSVRKGQLLAELDLDEIQAQVQQAQLGKQQADVTIKNAKLALTIAERDYRNAEGLFKDSVATLEQLENAETQLNNAQNQLEAAEMGMKFSAQTVEVANFNLKYSKISAPSNGTILRKLAEVNELASPGRSILLFGSKDKAQVIKVNLTDKDIIFVQIGNEAKVHFDAYPNHPFKGIVKEIASKADPYTGTYEVEIEVIPEGKKLLSGFIGQVYIKTTEEEELLEIPTDALLSANGQKGEVFVVENGRAKRRTIFIDQLTDDNLLVSQGLSIGEEVVISGVGYLEDEDSLSISQN